MIAKSQDAIVPSSFPWVPDQGDGTYRNPIIHADYSDPDVIRHGDDFWMVASSFNCAPGLPILHSKDLVNWTLVGHGLQKLPHPRYAAVQPGAGVWAPSIRFHDGNFWILFAMPDEGVYSIHAQHPAGPWSEPCLIAGSKGWIDPCPFWDDDGRAYLAHAYSFSRSGKKERIDLRPMTPDCRHLLGRGKELFHTPHHLYLEGPKVHKIDGFYYIFSPGGGVPTGWQVAFRSKSIWGPYEEKVILEQGSTSINGPHQGAFVDLPDGKWWFIHFQDLGAFGRVVHLQPVEWKEDGWPLVGQDFDGNGIGEPVARWEKPFADDQRVPTVPQTSDDFSLPTLRPQWQWNANPSADWLSLTDRANWLRLRAEAAEVNLQLYPRFLGQKFPARRFTLQTTIDVAEAPAGLIAGLAIVGGAQHAAIAIRRSARGEEIVFINDGLIEAVKRVSGSSFRFRASVDEEGTCSFSFAKAGSAFEAISQTMQADGGNWMGARVGLFAMLEPQSSPAATSAYADFSEFTFHANKPAANVTVNFA